MDTTEITIPKPCDADWSEMEGDARRRFCGACQQHVTDLSTYTERQAQSFVRENPDACVQYTAIGDQIFFAAPPRRKNSLRRPKALLRRVVQAGAIAAFAGVSPALASGQADSPSLIEWIAGWFEEEEVEVEVKVDVMEQKKQPIDKPMIPELDDEKLNHPLPAPIPPRPPIRTLRGRPAPRTK